MRRGGYKCYNTKCEDCLAESFCGAPGEIALLCRSRRLKPFSIADYIRSMTDEQMEGDLHAMLTDLCEGNFPHREFFQFWLNLPCKDWEIVLDAIDAAPTIDPSSLVKRGRWGEYERYELTPSLNGFPCSVCGQHQQIKTPHCPICGALMED